MIRFSVCLLVTATSALADPAVVEDANAKPSGDSYTFSVTLSHGDTGWDDHADAWRVVLADGTVIGERILLHPHVNEQPFTRSLGGVEVPAGVSEVFIEARTLNDPWGEDRFSVKIEN